jgi:hypothetical protein
MGERESKTPQAMKQRQQRRRTEAEKEADRAAMMAEAVLGPLTKPQAVLQRIIDENPNAGRSVWDALFLREVMDDPELRRAVVDEVFNDMWRRSHAN